MKTDAIARGKNSFNSKDSIAINASSGSNKFANLLSQGNPINPIITEGTARKTSGNVIDQGDSWSEPCSSSCSSSILISEANKSSFCNSLSSPLKSPSKVKK